MCVHAHASALRWRRHICVCACACVCERVCARARRREGEVSPGISMHTRACVRVRCDEQKMYTCTDVYVHMHLERCACNHVCTHNMSQKRASERDNYRSESHACVCLCASCVCVCMRQCVPLCADGIRVVLNSMCARVCVRASEGVCMCVSELLRARVWGWKCVRARVCARACVRKPPRTDRVHRRTRSTPEPP
jgi:hypothetical protein